MAASRGDRSDRGKRATSETARRGQRRGGAGKSGTSRGTAAPSRHRAQPAQVDAPVTRGRAEPVELRQAIGAHLAQLRRNAGMTQIAVSEQLGRVKSWIAKLERGQRSLLFSEAVELAELYGISLKTIWPPSLQDGALRRGR